MTVLMPMSQDEFLAFAREAVPAFAAEKVASGEWTPEESLERSRQSFAELLPQGHATKDNHFYTIRDSTGNVDVGMIWVAVQQRAGKRIAYVYEISVKPDYQRRGHATRALLALEEEVRALGLSGVALHVFGHNAAARALYVRLGFHPTNISMFKSIEGRTDRPA